VEERDERKQKGRGSRSLAVLKNTTRLVPHGKRHRVASNTVVGAGVLPPEGSSRVA